MARKHRGHGEEAHTDESWLIPYADLLTLLLALFIVLYASSNIDQTKYNAMAAAFYQQMAEGGGLQNPPATDPNDETTPDDTQDQMTEEESLKELQALLQQMLAEEGLEDSVSTSIDARGLIISMSDAVLFDPGEAVIKDQYRNVLIKIGRTIDRLPNLIRIEGHTDNVPQFSEIYPSNWELSTGRATSVLRLFENLSGIKPQKLSAIGYGKWRPVADNDTVENRNKNRRVDIIILHSRWNFLEGGGDRAQ
jgi:chemotaxis protein MotB